MFTGIIEEIGIVVSMQKEENLTLWDGSKGEGYVLVISCIVCHDGCYEGASVAVNGTCLTVTSFDSKNLTFGVAPETLRLTNLGKLVPGSKVNMERAAVEGARNSGHYVQGHVDNTGEIIEKTPENESLWVKVKVPRALISQIVHKGYVAVDGTSLTVCEVNHKESWFSFMLVQFTQTKVIIPHKNLGELVNIETDVLGKYVSRSVETIMQRVETLEKTFMTKLDDISQRMKALESR